MEGLEHILSQGGDTDIYILRDTDHFDEGKWAFLREQIPILSQKGVKTFGLEFPVAFNEVVSVLQNARDALKIPPQGKSREDIELFNRMANALSKEIFQDSFKSSYASLSEDERKVFGVDEAKAMRMGAEVYETITAFIENGITPVFIDMRQNPDLLKHYQLLYAAEKIAAEKQDNFSQMMLQSIRAEKDFQLTTVESLGQVTDNEEFAGYEEALKQKMSELSLQEVVNYGLSEEFKSHNLSGSKAMLMVGEGHFIYTLNDLDSFLAKEHLVHDIALHESADTYKARGELGLQNWYFSKGQGDTIDTRSIFALQYDMPDALLFMQENTQVTLPASTKLTKLPKECIQDVLLNASFLECEAPPPTPNAPLSPALKK